MRNFDKHVLFINLIIVGNCCSVFVRYFIQTYFYFASVLLVCMRCGVACHSYCIMPFIASTTATDAFDFVTNICTRYGKHTNSAQ